MRSASSTTTCWTCGDRDRLCARSGRSCGRVWRPPDRRPSPASRSASRSVPRRRSASARAADRDGSRCEFVTDLVRELARRHEHQTGGVVRARPSCIRCSTGRPKARVLPEPVLAFPHTSRPARASGMVSSWTGKGAVIPRSDRTPTISSASPRSANVMAVVVVGHLLLDRGSKEEGVARCVGRNHPSSATDRPTQATGPVSRS